MTNRSGFELVNAAKSGDTETVKRLLQTGNSALFKGEHEETALTVACEEGMTEVVELLIQRGLAVNDADGRGSTALLRAVALGSATGGEATPGKRRQCQCKRSAVRGYRADLHFPGRRHGNRH